jgi:hypothetical protein
LHYPAPLRITWQELAAAYQTWTQSIECNGGAHYKMYLCFQWLWLLRYRQLGKLYSTFLKYSGSIWDAILLTFVGRGTYNYKFM